MPSLAATFPTCEIVHGPNFTGNHECVSSNLASHNDVKKRTECIYDIGKHLRVLSFTKHDFRRNDFLSAPKVKTTTYGIKYLRFLGPKIWNSLPNKIKSSQISINSKLL